jgi:hypothetical protein
MMMMKMMKILWWLMFIPELLIPHPPHNKLLVVKHSVLIDLLSALHFVAVLVILDFSISSRI